MLPLLVGLHCCLEDAVADAKPAHYPMGLVQLITFKHNILKQWKQSIKCIWLIKKWLFGAIYNWLSCILSKYHIPTDNDLTSSVASKDAFFVPTL